MIMTCALHRFAVGSHVIRGLDLHIHPDRIQHLYLMDRAARLRLTAVSCTGLVGGNGVLGAIIGLAALRDRRRPAGGSI
jgi:hypothetical protein